ncbi:hypothetical protein DSM112329_01719 [Paraconexibacter sp. AEG42_29]|uniref:ABC transporter permease n=1 Tax=Paraconexibacter sp. AEG42_29 TaxID=2997339 RepID=A0AAU7ATD3_9ACTN
MALTDDRAGRDAAAVADRIAGGLVRQPGGSAVQTASETAGLFLKAGRMLFTGPYGWWRDCVVEMSLALRRCLLPMMLSIAAFCLGIAIGFVGMIIKTLGTSDRIPGGIYTGFMREPSIWVMSMIFAGVAGSALAADLGARRIREELDALSVLGVDNVRAIVLPRIVAMTLVAPILGLLTHLWSMFVLLVCLPLYFPSVGHATFFEVVNAFLIPGDLFAFLLKCVLIGALVGTVSCYKGLTAKGGAEGVGRAVNQAVVIMFLGLWILNGVFNSAFLALFPDVQTLRG